ncbi:MAG: hypothetical protein AAF740_10250 [Bacteroidota bacterium]
MKLYLGLLFLLIGQFAYGQNLIPCDSALTFITFTEGKKIYALEFEDRILKSKKNGRFYNEDDVQVRLKWWQEKAFPYKSSNPTYEHAASRVAELDKKLKPNYQRKETPLGETVLLVRFTYLEQAYERVYASYDGLLVELTAIHPEGETLPSLQELLLIATETLGRIKSLKALEGVCE